MCRALRASTWISIDACRASGNASTPTQGSVWLWERISCWVSLHEPETRREVDSGTPVLPRNHHGDPIQARHLGVYLKKWYVGGVNRCPSVCFTLLAGFCTGGLALAYLDLAGLGSWLRVLVQMALRWLEDLSAADDGLHTSVDCSHQYRCLGGVKEAVNHRAPDLRCELSAPYLISGTAL